MSRVVLRSRYLDLSNDQVWTTDPPTQPTTVQPPPSQDATAVKIAKILLAGYVATRTAQLIAALIPGVDARVVLAVLSLAKTPHVPDGAVGSAQRNAAVNEIYYRASYIESASLRVQQDVNDGQTQAQAVATEARNAELHDAARETRLRAVRTAGTFADLYGDWLGWYVNPLLNNEPECIAANGHNFLASVGTIIGYPGGVHPNCGCIAGPPVEGAGSVDDAVVASRLVRFGGLRKVKLRKAS